MAAISVIIPIYNVEEYLPKCLDSIINQTFNDIEIICVNDGSTDGSLDIVKDYAQKDSRIVVIDKKNGGLSSARNAGLEVATSDWISFIDSDDWLDEDAFEKIADVIPQNPDIICFGVHMRGEVSKELADSDEEYYKIKHSGFLNLNDEIRLTTDVATWNKIYKKSIIMDNNLTFPQGKHYEDYPFYWQYIFEAKTAYYLDKKFYNYLRRPNSIMANTFNKTSPKVIDHLYVSELIYDYLKNKNLLSAHIDTFRSIFLNCFWFAYCHANDTYKKQALLEATKLLKKFEIKNDDVILCALYDGRYEVIDPKELPLNRKLLSLIYSKRKDSNTTRIRILGIQVYKKKRDKFNTKKYFLGIKYSSKYNYKAAIETQNQTIQNIECKIDNIANKINEFNERQIHMVDNLMNIHNENIYHLNHLLSQNQQLQVKILLEKKIRKFANNNTKPKVVVIIYHRAHWSMETVCRKLQHRGFDLSILISPALEIEEELREKEMEDNYRFFTELGYNTIKGYNFQTKECYDLDANLPDIILYQTHWMVDILPEFNVKNFYDKALCVSIPYGFMVVNIQEYQFNQEFHQLVWLNCEETIVHKEMSERYAINKGINSIVTGYPKMDMLPSCPAYIWKINQPDVKRIIWAPHYSIDTDWNVNFANFHKIYKDFYNYVKNTPQIEVAFKPHPMLKSRCIQTNTMTAEEYDEFINNWNNLPNGQVITDVEYMPLFKSSDALVLDSLSFIAEYLYTQKPICFINKFLNKENLLTHFNEFGQLAIEQLYVANYFEEIKNFIEDVVINQNDCMLNQRKEFFEKYYQKNYGASGKYIVDYICNELEIK